MKFKVDDFSLFWSKRLKKNYLIFLNHDEDVRLLLNSLRIDETFIFENLTEI